MRPKCHPASIAHFSEVSALLDMCVAALLAALHRRRSEGMSCLDVVGTKIEIDFVHPVPSTFVINQIARPELRNGQESWPGKEFVASLIPTAAGHKCRKRQ